MGLSHTHIFMQGSQPKLFMQHLSRGAHLNFTEHVHWLWKDSTPSGLYSHLAEWLNFLKKKKKHWKSKCDEMNPDCSVIVYLDQSQHQWMDTEGLYKWLNAVHFMGRMNLLKCTCILHQDSLVGKTQSKYIRFIFIYLFMKNDWSIIKNISNGWELKSYLKKKVF